MAGICVGDIVNLWWLPDCRYIVRTCTVTSVGNDNAVLCRVHNDTGSGGGGGSEGSDLLFNSHTRPGFCATQTQVCSIARPCINLPPGKQVLVVGSDGEVQNAIVRSGPAEWKDGTRHLLQFGEAKELAHAENSNAWRKGIFLVEPDESTVATPVDLNRYNHAESRWWTAIDFCSKQLAYCKKLITSRKHYTVEDPLTGSARHVEEHLAQLHLRCESGVVVPELQQLSGASPNELDAVSLANWLLLDLNTNRVAGSFSLQPLLICADPGSGKTFLVQQVAYFLAKAVVAASGSKGSRRLVLVPLVIRVQKLVALLAARQDITMDTLKRYIRSTHQRARAVATMLETAVELRAVVLLVNGLDEATGPHRKKIEQFVVQTLPEHGCRVLVTSRPVGVRLDDYWEYRLRFAVLDLEPLNDKQQSKFVEKRLTEAEARAYTAYLEQVAAAGPSVAALHESFRQSPLEQSLLLVVVKNTHQLTTQSENLVPLGTRLDLYRTATDILLKRGRADKEAAAVTTLMKKLGLFLMTRDDGTVVRRFGTHQIGLALCAGKAVPVFLGTGDGGDGDDKDDVGGIAEEVDIRIRQTKDLERWAQLWMQLRTSPQKSCPLLRILGLSMSKNDYLDLADEWQQYLGQGDMSGGGTTGMPGSSVDDDEGDDDEVEFVHLAFQEAMFPDLLLQGLVPGFWDTNVLDRLSSPSLQNAFRIAGPLLGQIVGLTSALEKLETLTIGDFSSRQQIPFAWHTLCSAGLWSHFQSNLKELKLTSVRIEGTEVLFLC